MPGRRCGVWIAIALAVAVATAVAMREDDAPPRAVGAPAAGAADTAMPPPAPARPSAPGDGRAPLPSAETQTLETEQHAMRAAHHRALRARLAALAARGDAEAALERALLTPLLERGPWPHVDADTRAALREAAERAPGDPLIAWMEAVVCRPAECPRAVARLLRVDGDNAAAWLLAAGIAASLDDRAQALERLQRAVLAPRYVARGEAAMQAAWRALEPVALPPPSPALHRAQARMLPDLPAPDAATQRGLLASTAGPRWSGLQRGSAWGVLCDPTAMRAAVRRDLCLRAYALQARSTVLVERQAALLFLCRHTAGTPEHRLWREPLRETLWLVDLTRTRFFLRADLTATIARFGSLEGTLRFVRAQGLSDRPPPGWLPSLSHERALVLGQVPP